MSAGEARKTFPANTNTRQHFRSAAGRTGSRNQTRSPAVATVRHSDKTQINTWEAAAAMTRLIIAAHTALYRQPIQKQ